MALRLFNQINRNLFRNYKTRAISSHLKDSQTQERKLSDKTAIQEADENGDALTDGPARPRYDIQLPFPTRCLKHDAKMDLMAMFKPIEIHKSNPTNNQTRFFSAPNSPDCKVKTTSNPQCKKFKLCNCEQSAFKTCRFTVQPTKCKKKEAPYPSFSEACYEEPYNKPSECKLCPWKPDENPSFKGPVITFTKKFFHTGIPRVINNSDIIKKGNKITRYFSSEKTKKIWNLVGAEQLRTSSSIYKNAAIEDDLPNILDWISPRKLSLIQKEANDDITSGKCTKFPFKVLNYEIGSKPKEEVESCEKKPCVKKKRKLIKDCPADKEQVCSSSAYEDLFKGDILNKDVLAIVMKDEKGKDKCPEREPCEGTYAKKECPTKTGKTLNCPTDLIRPAGYKRKPKKNKTETASTNQLPLIPNPAYNGGVIYNHTTDQALPPSI